MTDRDDKIKELRKDLKATGLGAPKRTVNFEKSTLEFKKDYKTGDFTINHKFYKKDGEVHFNEMSEVSQTAEILMWARVNLEVWEHVVGKFLEAHNKPQSNEVH
jgi:hypothetical protein